MAETGTSLQRQAVDQIQISRAEFQIFCPLDQRTDKVVILLTIHHFLHTFIKILDTEADAVKANLL
jgi:hypothetical protein